MVDAAGDDRGERGVAVIPGPGERPRQRRPARPAIGVRGGLGEAGRQPRLPGGADPVEQLVQIELQLQLDGLPGPLRQAPGGQQPPARLFEGVVLALRDAAGVLGAHLLAERGEDVLQRRGAPAGQVTGDPAGAAQGGVQPQAAVGEPVIAVLIGAGGPAADLLRQRGQPGQVNPSGRGCGQDHVRVAPGPGRELVGPVGDLPGPRHRQPAARQRLSDRRVIGQPPHPAHRGPRRGSRRAGLPGQPRPRGPLTVVLEPALRREPRQHLRPGSRVHRRGLLKPAQAVRLHARRHRGHIVTGQPVQPGQHHPQRVTSRRRLRDPGRAW